jgi:hypothetical protein
MVSLEHHHRKIHWKTRLVRWALLPLALVAAPAWLYVSYGTCQEEGDQIGTLCHAFRVIPFLPTLAAIAILGFVAWDLAALGREHARETGERPSRRGLGHVRHGYRQIGDAHKRHIHKALTTVGLVTVAISAWIAWLAYQTTH